MTNFQPGKVINQFTLKNQVNIVFRYPTWNDLPAITDYINAISAEDTFLTMSGEQYTINQEAGFLSSKFVEIESQNSIFLLAFDGQICVGVCDVNRDLSQRSRGYHRSKLGLSIKKEYRGLGIGFNLAKNTIQEAKATLPNFKILLLDLFAENVAALSIYENLGFVHAGIVKNAFWRKGQYSDQLLMALYI